MSMISLAARNPLSMAPLTVHTSPLLLVASPAKNTQFSSDLARISREPRAFTEGEL